MFYGTASANADGGPARRADHHLRKLYTNTLFRSGRHRRRCCRRADLTSSDRPVPSLKGMALALLIGMRSAVLRARAHADLPAHARSRRKFLRFFPKGFHDQKYWAWERGYKWAAHERWLELLPKSK